MACASETSTRGLARVAPADAFGSADVLVVAPHPDDETLMAAGVIARERAAGRRVAVAVITNGDLGCERDGFTREGETVAAMKRLGLREEDVFFLGYPDGHLEELGPVPLAPLVRRDGTGRCTPGNTTYAGRGAGRTDLHALLTGRPGLYTSDALVFDLGSLIEKLRPRDVFVSHPVDEHPDHAFAYTYVRRALEARPGVLPRIHRAVVHIGGCWPTKPGHPPCGEMRRFVPAADVPPLPPPLDVYVPSERLDVPEAMKSADRLANTKFLAITDYPSQTGPLEPDLSYLFAFVRAREPFYVETLVADGGGRVRRVRSTAEGAVGEAGPWREEGSAASRASRRDLAQRAPLRCRVGSAGAESRLELLHGAEGHYTLRSGAKEVVLERAGGGATAGATGGAAPSEASILRRWPVPAAARPAGRRSFEVAVDVRPEEGGVAEITVRRDGELLGVVIDPRPLLTGSTVAVAGAALDQVRCEPY